MTSEAGSARTQAMDLDPLVGAVLVSIDSGGLITAWTGQAERAFGWRRGEVIGHPLVATVAAPSRRTAHERDVERVLSGEASASEHSFEMQARHRDGRDFRAEVALVRVPFGRGYEFSAFLDQMASREWTADEVAGMRERHPAVVDAALAAFRGDALGDEVEEPRRAAGALVLFRAQGMGDRAQEAELPAPGADPVAPLPAVVEQPPAAISAELIRQTLEEGRFGLSAQPVLDLRTNKVAHHELLPRMTDEQGGLVLPQEFAGVAQRAGLTRAIDAWLVQRAIGLIAEHAVRLELTLSADSLGDPELGAAIERELGTSGADPGCLVFGIGEQAVSDNLELVTALAKRLKGIGCRFALREFGSSFAAMRHLKQLPLDYIKLDGGLVSTFADSRTDQLVLKAVVEIADGIGAETVAELVSDERTLVLLRQAGVSYAQGYHVGAPRSVSELWSSSAG